jgi:hypothetical protein
VLGHFDARLATFVASIPITSMTLIARMPVCFNNWSLGYLAFCFALMLASILLLARSAARSDNWTFPRYDARLDVSLASMLLASLLLIDHCLVAWSYSF